MLVAVTIAALNSGNIPGRNPLYCAFPRREVEGPIRHHGSHHITCPKHQRHTGLLGARYEATRWLPNGKVLLDLVQERHIRTALAIPCWPV
jgi:hypothetical protein